LGLWWLEPAPEFREAGRIGRALRTNNFYYATVRGKTKMVRKTIIVLLVLAALVGTQIVAANAEVVTFRRLFGGSNQDFARGIFVDSNHIYVVGDTESFGPNTPNLFLSIFNLDNSHRCSVAVDLGSFESG